MTKIEELEEVLAEYNHAKKLKKLNEELLEHLNSMIRWLLHYCEKNDLRPPNLDILENAIERSQDYIQKMSPDQPTKNTTKNDRFGHRTNNR